MNGYSSHTYKWYNDKGEHFWVKYHFKTEQGIQNFTRDEAKDMIRKAGGSISSSVSQKTSYVLAGKNPGSKVDKARDLKIKIINENEFRKLAK